MLVTALDQPLEDLRVVWPTRSRTGSQFVVQLTNAVRGEMMPQSRVTGARRDTFKADEKTGNFKEMFAEGRGYEFLADNGIRSMKFEDPGKDDFVLGLLDAAPNAVFVASYRPIERVIESHYNIKRWGHGEADVLHQFSACASLYEQLADRGRMFLIDVERKDLFNPQAFLRFMGVESLGRRAAGIVDAWTPVNDLKSQVERGGGEFTERFEVPRLERLREIHPWVSDVEKRYTDLCARTNDLTRSA